MEKCSVKVSFDDFFHNKNAKSVLGLSIRDAALFTKQTFLNQFKKPKTDEFPIWK